MTTAPTPGRSCGRCGAGLQHTAYEVRAGDLRLVRCSLLNGVLLRRSLAIALVVGTILTAINQGNIIAHGDFPNALYWKIPLTYAVPFCVAAAGAVLNSHSPAPGR